LFAGLAGAWVLVNWYAVGRYLAHERAMEPAIVARLHALAGDKPVHWNYAWLDAVSTHPLWAVFPQILLLVAGAAIAVVLRSHARGAWFATAPFVLAMTGAAVAPGDTLRTMAGHGVAADISPVMPFQAFDPAVYLGQLPLVCVAVSLALAAVLLPAALLRPSTAGAVERRDALRTLAFPLAAVAVAVIAVVFHAGTFLGLVDAGAVLLALAVARLAYLRGTRLVPLLTLAASYALVVLVRTHDLTPIGCYRAVLIGFAVAGLPALARAPWRALRGRLNGGRRPVATGQV
jgi:hypothetical protein